MTIIRILREGVTAVHEAVFMWSPRRRHGQDAGLCPWASSVFDRIISLDLLFIAKMVPSQMCA